jgi:hypothetical protein
MTGALLSSHSSTCRPFDMAKRSMLSEPPNGTDSMNDNLPCSGALALILSSCLLILASERRLVTCIPN